MLGLHTTPWSIFPANIFGTTERNRVEFAARFGGRGKGEGSGGITTIFL